MPRTLDRARRRLDIVSVPVHIGKPGRTNYWLLPGQALPTDQGIDESTLVVDEWMTKLAAQCPALTPLDENLRGMK